MCRIKNSIVKVLAEGRIVHDPMELKYYRIPCHVLARFSRRQGRERIVGHTRIFLLNNHNFKEYNKF